MSIKERLRLVIESQKLTVKDFAELVDTPLRTVHNYLNSGKEPSMEFLSKISKKFNINLNWLLLNQEDMFLTEKDINLNLDESELINNYRSANEVGKRILKRTSKIIFNELSNNDVQHSD